ncbi:hypothetical protein TNIN_332191 [Trichonephila inaurata madagascariensis]|uniref:Uncharacterized protein n=1 Tax=Trichonephila inaurata madagascariensis TaxID=2747483 RepID=A0A8X7C358_9ARAC|nr:hypothetical protein TNIN_332191 [Trichonephila inaurata madagascariensis]
MNVLELSALAVTVGGNFVTGNIPVTNSHRSTSDESMTGRIVASRRWTQALVAGKFRSACPFSSAPVECKLSRGATCKNWWTANERCEGYSSLEFERVEIRIGKMFTISLD